AAGRGEHTLARDLDHARAAIAIRALAFRVAKPRDRHAEAIGDLQDRFVGTRGDRGPVERELDERGLGLDFRHGGHDGASLRPGLVPASAVAAISWGKYLMTQRMGLGAACPSPQIDASAMTCESSSRSG